MDNVIRQLHRLATRQGAGVPSDEQLLEQFFLGRDEEAFALLVRRHGPMVYGACLRVLHHRQNAEDAFQATFLALVRKGQSIRQPGALASWLYRVAFRVALRLKSNVDKRSTDALTEVPVEADPAANAAWRELRPVLDAELQRLPAKYRTPMILCYLEGKTYEEVAGTLGCPKGTVAIRLLRGRLMLKNRLLRRGLMGAAGWLATQAALPQALAAVPPALAASTGTAAAALSAGAVLSSLVPSGVAALVDATRTVWVPKVTALALLLAAVAGTGVGVATMTLRGDRPATVAVAEVAAAPQPEAQAAAPLPPVAAEKPAAQEPEPIPPPQPLQAQAAPRDDESRHFVVIRRFPADCGNGEAPCKDRSCRGTTTVIVVSERPHTGLAWRERGDDDIEMTRRTTVYRVIIVSDRDHSAVLAEVVRYLIRSRG